MAETENKALSKDSMHSLPIKHEVKSANDDVIDSPKISDPVDKKGSLSKKNVDLAAPRLPPKPVREQARVIYPYTALNEDELNLKEGDIITVISKEVEDKGWWKGELNNKTGVFPDNFVQLIKVAEEQKKPERPEKPSSALVSKANLKSSSDKTVPEFSPKIDKKSIKTPPAKPPPPEIHKKEHDKVTPPFPIKKPQIPYPMKKPSRSSLGSKFSGFSPPSTISSSKPPDTPPPVPPAPATLPVTSTSEYKPEVTKSTTEKTKEKEEKDSKKENKDTGFEGLESSGKKLVHLTANRAKVPNRRPPSHIFLRENDKENGVSVDPRRLSEPLLSEMKLMHQIGEVDSQKATVTCTNYTSNNTKVKIPPSRPLPPSVKGNKPAIQGSLILTKTISSEECIVKAPEPIKKSILPDISTTSTTILGPESLPSKRIDAPLSDFKPVSSDKEMLQPKKTDVPSSEFKPFTSDKEVQQAKKTDVSSSDFKPVSSDKDVLDSLQSLKTTMVNRKEFNDLAKQVKELKESLEKCVSMNKKTIDELKSELELERKKRQGLEIELQQMRESQST